MDKELNSLPAALAAEIQQLANQLTPQGQRHSDDPFDDRPARVVQQVEPAINRALLQIAQASPELLASIILAQLGVTAIEVTESEEHREDRLVEQRNGNYHYTDVEPFTTRRTITRQVRLVTGERASIGRLR